MQQQYLTIILILNILIILFQQWRISSLEKKFEDYSKEILDTKLQTLLAFNKMQKEIEEIKH